jgi:hypothetical protein
MKKIALTLAGVAAIATFAPEASAIPAFARQVGMACSACHYQHFPVLNAFGRSFKQGGYTMVGAQEKIEGEGLSLPSTLNTAIVGYVAYTKTSGAPTAANTTTGGPNYGNLNTNDGSLQIPQQVSLFAGGRGGENFGYEAEINLNGTSAQGAGTGQGAAGLIRFKIPFVVEAGGLKTQVIPFSTANGVADSFEVLNTGAVSVHAFNQSDMSAVSAAQYINTQTTANGLALVTSNENFFANISKWGANVGDGTSGGAAVTSNYVRGAWTGDLGGFDSAIGFQSWGGNSVSDSVAYAATTPFGVYNTQAFAIDAQMMGDVGGMPLLIVASYAKAPASPVVGTGAANLFNQNQLDRSTFNIGVELGIVQNVATVQLAYRNAKSGMDVGTITGGTATGANASDNAVLLGLTYAIALNARLELTQSWYSGDIYASNSNAVTTGNSQTVVDLAFAF